MLVSWIVVSLALCLALGSCTQQGIEPSSEDVAAAEAMGEFELIQMARGRRFPASRIQAIEALGARNTPSSGQALASLLVPHERLAIRQAAANGLQSSNCEAICIESIMDYLERRTRGELGVEEWMASHRGESARAAAEARESELYYSLERVMRANPRATLTVLVDHYGIETMLGSEFALKLVSEMRFAAACPSMLKVSEMFSTSQALEPSPALVEALDVCGS